ncbi:MULTISPECIES: ABC transporter ATP-binding protein [Moorena]|uniref:ABC-type multidrug transport system, ATPase and permease component n=1 Tax=Moorena producens 3L TaxID=489825 RepID=F4XY65_9CYAN|nr:MULTISPECIES: ABC transporter ATP-binding protein [Moorena]EGJ30462.1 ABC-type multidrug transport system, ATPase and permease component [Moorena producens 3L]NEP65880.1 ABC transporter ATP-binding protein [Moorena sp. SIO3A5]NER87368.1 ABC transporter ATP-binding protein [Moorena sp. SIO3A2]OLT68643.1 multidrug ABC transporter ATP-binding protein [Moorena producens 3L]
MISNLRSTVQLASYLPKTLSLIWQSAHHWTIAWLILLVLQGCLPVATLYLTRSLVDRLVAVVGAGLQPETIRLVMLPIALFGGVLLLTEILKGISEWVRTAQAEIVQDYISDLVHQQSLAIDLACYESSEYHDYLNRARSGAGGRSLALMENLGILLQSSITLISVIAILLPYGILLPIAIVIGTLPGFYVVLRLNRHHHQWWQKTTLDRRWLEYYEIVLTHSAAAAEVRVFGLGTHFRTAYQTLRQRLRLEHLQLIKQRSLGRFGANLITLLVLSGAIVWIGQQMLLGLITMGDVALFYQAFNRGQELMKSLLGNIGEIYKNSLFVSNLFAFLNLEPKVVDPPQPKTIPSSLQQGIRFRQVSFKYPGSQHLVLENFNLTIPAGKIVAIVGDNGAGKTTLTKLLCRFYDPESGSVELDGVDLKNFSVADLRKAITVLFQFPLRHVATPAENITFGNLAESANLPAVETAAQAAGIHERILRLPQEYNSLLGTSFPGGVDLSGGEWQRLALARAFFRQAPIIILDEPTSAMDPWAEMDWLNRFRILAQGQTAIVITHRFTLAMRADLIYVMRDGKIVESGSHDELVTQGGLYAESWQAQMHSSERETDQGMHLSFTQILRLKAKKLLQFPEL